MGLIRRIGRRLLGRGERTPSPQSAGGEDLKESLSRLDCEAQELMERLEAGEAITIVDVRGAAELDGGVLPGAVHIPLDELEVRWRELEDADEVVCYSAAGSRSLRAARLLRARGLINATSLDGGLPSWRRAGGMMTPPGR